MGRVFDTFSELSLRLDAEVSALLRHSRNRGLRPSFSPLVVHPDQLAFRTDGEAFKVFPRCIVIAHGRQAGAASPAMGEA
jgi:hypothetical protein